MLSALVTCLGQDGHDLVGPDAAQGPDRIQDLHLHFSGLSGSVSGIVIQAPGGFQWATAPDPAGAALAEYFPSSNPLQGDLYLNPQVKSDQGPAGSTLPLGGSTGSLIGLANGALLSVAISYADQSSPVTASVVITGLISPTDPMPTIATPGNVVGTFTVNVDGQDGTGQAFETGYVHLVVTAPDGASFLSGTFSQVYWGLSDQAGLAWDSTSATLGHNHIYATLRPGNKAADLYFAPQRNEAPANGSGAPTLLLRVAIPGDNNVYVTPFAGANWDLSARTNAIVAQAKPGAPPTTEAELRSDLMSNSPEYDTIDLPANATIVITQPLEITHSVKINGQNATLLFDQGSTSPWPAAASGAIYVDAPAYTNIQLDLVNFTIKFDTSAPIRWSNPVGAGPALYDPENNPGGVQHAVLDTRDSDSNLNMTLLTLSNMKIDGPPAFDGSAFASHAAQLQQTGDTVHQYVGEQDLDLIRSNDDDTGTIAGSSFQGGSIEVFGGPWTITGNTIAGSTAYTYSPGAFALHSAHDVLIEGNQVTQSDPGGREFRLVDLAVSGFNNLITGNSFTGGAGQIGNEVGYSADSGQFGGLNDPEVILAESSYGVLFEGRPGAISNDGRLLVLPLLRASAYQGFTGPGIVVSILAGASGNGAPQMQMAGQWFAVAQQVSLSSANTIELLMEDPLPAAPAGGYYVIEVTGGFVNNSFTNNQLDLAGKSSTGIVLSGEAYGTRITGNHLVGGTIYNNVYTGAAISVGAPIGSSPSGSGAFPLPAGWTALPDLGAIIEDNIIDDSLGGIIIGVQHSVNYWGAQVGSTSETGRVFLTATVSGNTFRYHSSFLGSWANASAEQGNNPDQTTVPPTVTIGSGFTAEPPGPYGSPRFPWSVGNAITVNGNYAPIFIDPTENVVTLHGNSTWMIAANGTITSSNGPSGQVYAGIVNGAVDAPRIAAQTYNNQPYFPFNLDNLDISVPADPSPSPPPPVPPAAPVPSAPTNLSAGLASLDEIRLSWAGATGATYYVVERSTNDVTWSVLAANVAATGLLDPGLNFSTTYYYRVFAGSSAGTSTASSIVSAETGAQPDLLSAQAVILHPARNSRFNAVVATFTDANAATGATRFIATINWGDGSVSLGAVTRASGAFTIRGTHRYARTGLFSVQVTISLSNPEPESAAATSFARVGKPAKHQPPVRLRGVLHPLKKLTRLSKRMLR
jgi:hypothetical protein